MNNVCGVNCSFFFQAEDGIRDAQESRGLGDVYKRQGLQRGQVPCLTSTWRRVDSGGGVGLVAEGVVQGLSLIHI